MEKCIEIFNTAGGVGLFVDAKDQAAKCYYEQFGFVSLPSNELELFLPVRTIQEGHDPAPVNLQNQPFSRLPFLLPSVMGQPQRTMLWLTTFTVVQWACCCPATKRRVRRQDISRSDLRFVPALSHISAMTLLIGRPYSPHR